MMTDHYCYRKWKKYQRKKAHQRCARERASLRDGMRKVILSIIRSLVLMLVYRNLAAVVSKVRTTKDELAVYESISRLTLYTLTSVCSFSFLFPIHFLGAGKENLFNNQKLH